MTEAFLKSWTLDEAWAFLNVAQGETLSNKLVRAGRAMNAGVYFVTQSSGDVSKESLKNNIGLKFAFRSTDTNEIKQTLEFFGLDSEGRKQPETVERFGERTMLNAGFIRACRCGTDTPPYFRFSKSTTSRLAYVLCFSVHQVRNSGCCRSIHLGNPL